ncbi:MAG: hypothetical protein V1661_02200 [bacterium]
MTIHQLQKQFNTLRAQKRYTEGINLIKKWIKDNSRNPQALYMLGELLDKRALTRKNQELKKNDESEARSLYKFLIKNYTSNKDGYFGLIRLYLRNKNKKAFEIANTYVKISKDNAYNMYIGHCYLNFNDLDNAEKYYLKAYPYIKNHYSPDYALAKLYLQKKNLKKAKEYAKRSISKFKKMDKKYHSSQLAQNYIREMEKIKKMEAV